MAIKKSQKINRKFKEENQPGLKKEEQISGLQPEKNEPAVSGPAHLPDAENRKPRTQDVAVSGPSDLSAEMEEEPARTSRKTMLTGILIFIGMLALVLFVVFRNVTPREMGMAFKSVNLWVIFIGMMMMVIYGVGEGLNIRRPLRMMGYHITVWQGLKYAIAGFFFSSVTPSSTGGQPMQLYYMHKDGVKVSHGVLALLVQLLGYETATVTLAVIGFFTQNGILEQTMGPMKHLLAIGIVLNILFLLFIVLCLFSKTAIRIICNILLKIVGFFGKNGKKKGGRAVDKIEGILHDYGDMAGQLHGHMDIVGKTLITSFIQFFAMYLIPFLVYKGFHLSGYGPVQIELLQAVLYVAVGFVPIPGATGVSEGAFVWIFRAIFPKKILASAMLISRCISLYFCVILDGIILNVWTQWDLRRQGQKKTRRRRSGA